jgi:hypothetical protein
MKNEELCNMFGLDYKPRESTDILLKDGDMITVGELNLQL